MIAKARKSRAAVVKALIRAVIYCRMSDDSQDKSIARQLADIKEYATANGYDIIREYVDEGMSGDADDRKQFQAMVQDATRLADFTVVLCYDQNRFSRFDPMKAITYWQQLRTAGVGLVTVNQGVFDFDDIGGFIKATVNQFAANIFLKDLSRTVSAGNRKAASEGNWINGTPVFGYISVDCRLVIDEERAAIVRWMYREILARDVGVCWLAAELTRRRIQTPKGGVTWNIGTVKNLLSNRAFLGTKIYGASPKGQHYRILAGQVTPVGGSDGGAVVNPKDGKLMAGKQSLEDCIVVEGAYPAIIDQATFDAVQIALGLRQRPQRTKRLGYELSGLLWCAHCGGRVCGTKSTGYVGRKQYRYYMCATRKTPETKPECRYLVAAERLESLIKDHVRSDFLSDEQIESYCDRQRAYVARRRVDHSGRAAQLTKRQATLDKKIEEIEEHLGEAPPDMRVAIYKQLRAVREDRAAVHLELDSERRIGALDERDSRLSVDQFAAQRRELRDALDETDGMVIRRALRQIVDRIDVFSKPPSGETARKNTKRSFSHAEVLTSIDLLPIEHDGVSSCSMAKTSIIREKVVLSLDSSCTPRR